MAGIDNNTVLYLRGDSFKDLSPNPKAVSNSGATIVDDGVFSKALLLSSSNYINVDADSSIDFGTGDFTLSCYVKPNGTGGTLFAYQWANSTTGYAWGIRIVSSKVRFMINTGSEKYIDSSSNVSTSSFTHIAITRENGVVKLFVNGKLESIVTYSGSLLVNSQKRVSIGKHSNNSVGGFDGSISDIFISNKCLYTEDFTPPTQPFNSISINVTNKTFSQIDFNISKLGQENINKVEVLQGNVVKETYTDNFDNLTYNIDNSLCSIGNNKITIRVTYDDNYIEEEILTHTVTVDKLPTSSSLKDVIDRQELLNNSIEVQKNNLKNILVGKNVEVAEEENKLSSLIDKVDLLGEYDDDKLYLYKDGVFKNYNHSILKVGNVYGNSALNDNFINLAINTTSSSQWSYIGLSSTNTIDVSDYKKLNVKVKYNKFTPNNSSNIETLATLRRENSLDTDKIASIKVISMTTNNEYTYSLDISNLTGNYVCQFVIGAYMVVSNIDVNIYQMWLEK